MTNPSKRRALLQRLRVEQTREEAALDPSERWQRSLELLALSGDAPTTDEPPELWLAIKRRLREASE